MSIEAARLLAVIDGDATGAIRAYDAAERKGKSSAAALDKVGKAAEKSVAVGVTAVAVGFGAAIATASGFDKQMSSVQAKASATQGDFAMLRAEALKLGADTVFTSSQAAQGMDVLAAAGFDAKQIFQAMPGAVNASIAAGGDFAGTAEIMASTMRQFNMEAGQFGHIGDVLAKAANVSNANISDLGVSMRYAGPVASTLGVSFEETSAALALMANQGFKADMAGTGLRMALMRLTTIGPQTEKKLGGVGKGLQSALRAAPTLSDKLNVLRRVMDGMSKNQKVGFIQKLVGTEAAPQLLSLLNQSSDALARMTMELQNSDGAAKQAADTMTNNFYGSTQQLWGSVESGAIAIGTALTPNIRKLTDELTGAVNGFNGLSAEQQQQIIQTVALTAAFAGGALMAVKLAQGIATIVTAASAAAGPVGLLWVALGAIGGLAATAAINQALFVGSLQDTSSYADQTATAIRNLKGAMDELNGAILGEKEADLQVKIARDAQKTARRNTKAAEKQFGKNSPEAKTARLGEEQAALGVERAQRGVAAAAAKRAEADKKAEDQTLKTVKAMKKQADAAFWQQAALAGVTGKEQALESAAKRTATAVTNFAKAARKAGVPESVITSIANLIARTEALKVSAGLAADALDKMYGAGAGNATRAAANYGGKGFALGGRASGPTSGYPTTLHGSEWVIPEDNSARALSLWQAAGRAIGAIGGKDTASGISVTAAGTTGGITVQGDLIVQVPDGKFSTFTNELASKVSGSKRRLAVTG